MALPVSRLIRAQIQLSPQAAARRSFGILMVAGDSSVINGLERFRTYGSYEEVVEDFGVQAPESRAAALYFGQSPKPNTMMIGRWLRTATAAMNMGGILSSSQQLMSNWTSISNGSFSIDIDGTQQDLTGLDFSAQSNLNGVASVISTALSGASCVFSGGRFTISSASTGAGVNASGSLTFTGNPSFGVRSTGFLELDSANPDPGNVFVVNGTTIEFVSSSPVGNQVLIGTGYSDTLNNLLAFLQASTDVDIALNLYQRVGDQIIVTARIYGSAGDAYTLSKTGTNLIVSGATLSGGVDADEIDINGEVFTFVQSGSGANEIVVAPTMLQTAANVQAKLSASVLTDVALASYSRSEEVITITFKETGVAGNAFTISSTTLDVQASGANLTGGADGSEVSFASPEGTGTDISGLLRLTQAQGAVLVSGFSAETPAECTAALANASALWYGLIFQASVALTDEQSLAVSSVVQALGLKRIYGITITNTNVLSAQVSNDLASLMRDGGFTRSTCQYSENDAAIASMFGRAFSVNFNANRSTITLMYKQEPGVAPADLSTSQANALQDKRCNVFVKYVNDTAIIQYGTMSGPVYFDEIHGLDWFEDAIQNACYNLLFTSTTKIPQTDSGVNQLVTAIAAVCEEAVNNGLVGPGTWTGGEFGQLTTGQYLKSGYYIYAQPLALQSQADREARKAPPIQVAIKLQGAIQEVDVLIEVNR